MIRMYSKKDLVELCMEEDDKLNITQTYNILLFSDMKIEEINPFLSEKLKIKDKNISKLFNFVYSRRDIFIREGKKEINGITLDFFNCRLLELFNELNYHQKYKLLKNRHFYKENPEIFQELLPRFFNDIDEDSYNVGVAINNVMKIPDAYFEQLRDKNVFLEIKCQYYNLEELEKVLSLTDKQDCLKINDGFLSFFKAGVRRLRYRADIDALLETPDSQLSSLSISDGSTVFILKNLDFFHTLIVANRKVSKVREINSWFVRYEKYLGKSNTLLK